MLLDYDLEWTINPVGLTCLLVKYNLGLVTVHSSVFVGRYVAEVVCAE